MDLRVYDYRVLGALCRGDAWQGMTIVDIAVQCRTPRPIQLIPILARLRRTGCIEQRLEGESWPGSSDRIDDHLTHRPACPRYRPTQKGYEAYTAWVSSSRGR